MANRLPEKPDSADQGDDEARSRDGDRYLAIGTLHLHGNDLAELRKIASENPALAERIIEQRDHEDARANASYRFGVVSSLILLAMALASFTFILVWAGLLATIGLALATLAIAVLIRVVLTGEWSDTSWFGKVVKALARLLGSADV
ncbi:hypothetical protein [Afifella sp. IM 167]|uniref:hypothetical protein n=1 Tax=Afifella sp. IM 167 TaxID=2033586 RepID=UPI001CCA6DE4|nr:hypothetical protein [Afifella sp. IM 167]MBZ8133919.1 hypothetical protein [Afifella sp. IM 167]